jgi:6-phosphogluconolactonase (cycloisomerase 2 family)
MGRWCILAAAALGLAGCDSVFGTDGESDRGAVFTMNNAASANYVIVFSRDQDGSLVRMDSVATGGRGSGPDPVFGTDPLTSQDAVILGDDHRTLFVVNAGSNEVSSFRVTSGGAPTLVSRVSSGGVFPVSLAVRGGLLYVVNANNGGTISGFQVGGDGSLTPLAGSARTLSSAPAPGPGSIRISPDGRALVVTEKPTNLLDVFALDATWLTTGKVVVSSPGMTPFGADYDAIGHYILSEGHIGPNRAAVPDASTVSSLSISSITGAVSVITGSAPTTETAACWIQITPDGRFAYTTNTASGSITGFSIGADGTLTRLTADGKTGVTGPATQPLDMAYANGYLYALTAGDGGIKIFRVEADGSLTSRTGVGGLPISVTGLAAF